MGTGRPNLEQAELDGQTAGDLRDVLTREVPGFADLQARVAPYIQRQRELQMATRSIIGRAIKPLGKTAPAPRGKLLEEGLEETTGYTPSQITEKTARELVGPLFRSSSTDDLMNFIHGRPEVPEAYPDILRDLPALGAIPGVTATGQRPFMVRPWDLGWKPQQ
jgi:hypothetical protein